MPVMIVVFATMLFSFTGAYANCTLEDMPQIACAKQGDMSASQGSLADAVKSWKMSCDLGLESSCDYIIKYKADKNQFYKDFNISPQAIQCSKGKVSTKKCLEISNKLMENNPATAAKILYSLCDRDVAEACFKLGNHFFKQEYYSGAEAVYLKSCQNDHAASCALLNQVSVKVAQLENNKAIDRAMYKQNQKMNAMEKRAVNRDIWNAIFIYSRTR